MNTAAEELPPSTAPKKRTLWGVVRRIILGLILCYVAVIALLMIFEESLIFFPSKYPDGFWQPRGLHFEDAWFEAADGIKLHGWFVPHDSPRAVVLFAHGNAGNISHREDLFRALNQLGVAVLAYDYRGYGRSEGTPNEAGVVADGRAARKWLAKRASVREQDIVLMGESLGGAVAVALAAEVPARGLIL
jgi:pimeloyl-ACP methyl ester carboxylesterase